MRVLVFGEILWDMFEQSRHLGGAPLNFAGHLAGLGGDPLLISAVGADPLGTEALKELERLGLSRDFVAVLDKIPTGRCMVTLTDSGVPHYDLWENAAYDRIPCPDAHGCRGLYFGTLALRSPENFKTLKRLTSRDTFDTVLVDLNLRPPFVSREAVDFALRHATVLKISLEECPDTAELLGLSYSGYVPLARELKTRYPQIGTFLVTLGAEGAWGWDTERGEERICPGVSVSVCSTVGAGDSFCAGFFHSRDQGRTFAQCLEFGVKLSAWVVSQEAAIPEGFHTIS